MNTDTTIEEKKVVERSLKEPPRYKVIVLNDNVTPMEFVIAMLIAIFRYDEKTAYDLTMEVHHQGSAVAGVYSHEVAEQKVVDGTNMARANNFPLNLKSEAE
jgi:ATP-dependent Clp protease adaptor protein ClpS